MKGRIVVENVVLTVHLILAVLLTGVVLLQRSEGGGLGMGGGGGGGGVMTGRQAANALTRLTWIFGIGIFVTSVTLTVIAARQTSNSSIMDQLGVGSAGQSQQQGTSDMPVYTPPPMTSGDPLTPPSSDAPASGAPAATAPAATTPDAAPADLVAPPASVAPAAEAPATAPATDAPQAATPEAAAPEAATPDASAPAAPASPTPASPAPATPAN